MCLHNRVNSPLAYAPLAMSSAFAHATIGTPGQPWGPEEVAQWRARQVRQRSHADDVLANDRDLREQEQQARLVREAQVQQLAERQRQQLAQRPPPPLFNRDRERTNALSSTLDREL